MAEARQRKLKVFRTPIGFHDAYVAAPSQKAALDAWGADTNLFAAGVAEVVVDPALTKAPLARPGEVIKALRGSAAEHVAAAETQRAAGRKRAVKVEDHPSTSSDHGKAGGTSPSPRRETKRKRPSRAAVEKAEVALTEAVGRRDAAVEKLRREEEALREKRRALELAHSAERKRLENAASKARAAFRTAMAAWTE